MKISWVETPSHGAILEAGEVGRWDGSPRRSRMQLDLVPTSADANRLAVAATLVFGEYFGGVVDFGRRVNIVTAGAVQRYCEPARVFPHNIDEGPKEITTGDGVLEVRRYEGEADLIEQPLAVRQLFLADATSFRGALLHHRGALVASNVLDFDVENEAGAPVGSLAAGVLFATHFHASQIVLCLREEVPKSWLQRSRDLLSSVGIGLEIQLQVRNYK